MDLEKEKFESVEELSKIQTALSTAKAELLALETEKDTFLAEREGETKKRINAVLETLRDTLAQADAYKDELKRYRKSVESFVSEVREVTTSLSHIREELHSEFQAFDDYSRGIMSELNTLSASVKREQSNLQAEFKSIEHDRAIIRDEWRLLKDRQQTLKDGFAELKKLKSKK